MSSVSDNLWWPESLWQALLTDLRQRGLAAIERQSADTKEFMVSTTEPVTRLGDGDDRFVALLGRT